MQPPIETAIDFACRAVVLPWVSAVYVVASWKTANDAASQDGEGSVAQPIEQAPARVRELLPSREEREAQHAEAQAILEAIRRGDRSSVVTVGELLRELDVLDGAEESSS